MRAAEGHKQKTFRKCAINGKEGGETYRLRARGSGLTAFEKTLRGERMCVTTVRKCTDNGNEVDNDDKPDYARPQILSHDPRF